MARTYEPLARRLCKALFDLNGGKPPRASDEPAADPGKPAKWVTIVAAAKQINVSDQEMIHGAINHAAHKGWLTVDGKPIHSLRLTPAGQKAGLSKK